MAAPVNVQLRNAESAILFMQQEHAKTLQGLHQELQKLQKKCAELTFELAMKSGSPDEESHEKQQLLESQLEEKTAECTKVQTELQQRDAKINILEQQAKMQQRHHQEEIKQYQQQVAAMTRDLEERSTNVAYLTTQLHQLKLRHHALRSSDEMMLPPAREYIGSPAPPKDKPQQRPRRHKVRSGSMGPENPKAPMQAVHPSNLDCRYTGSSPPQYIITAQCASSAGSNRSSCVSHSQNNITDLHPFLTPNTRSRDVKKTAPPPVLPPIPPNDERNQNGMDKCTAFAKRPLHRSNPDAEQGAAVETLAVQKVCSGESDLRRLEQSHTD